VDGPVVPCAAAGALMFTPDLSKAALGAMAQSQGVYTGYGLADAFHPRTVAEDTIGLDVGITLLAAENCTAGTVWKCFMGNAEVPRALEIAELRNHHSDTEAQR